MYKTRECENESLRRNAKGRMPTTNAEKCTDRGFSYTYSKASSVDRFDMFDIDS